MSNADAQVKTFCEQQVEKDLPLVIHLLVTQINPGQLCQILKLCKNKSEDQWLEVLDRHISKVHVSSERGVRASEMSTASTCTICVFIVERLKCLLPKDKAEAAVERILDHACSLLPKPVEFICDTFISRYSGKLIDLLLDSATPHAICTMLQLCQKQDKPLQVEATPTDCESCQTLAFLSRLHLGTNATELESTSFLQSVCGLHSCALPKCNVFTQRFGPKLQRILGTEGSILDICRKVDFCSSSTTAETGNEDNCNRSSRYRCRDMRTALACNSVSFCQRFFWK
ncbi:surfactant protein Ba [Scleropages formosus]|uniref:surfactant protein Ba n=1 Tax=Scleropages formosus TaxID=113540 RepID=UPI0010FAC976|nr:prosaposin-like [Scleropages formosus]